MGNPLHQRAETTTRTCVSFYQARIRDKSAAFSNACEYMDSSRRLADDTNTYLTEFGRQVALMALKPRLEILAFCA